MICYPKCIQAMLNLPLLTDEERAWYDARMKEEALPRIRDDPIIEESPLSFEDVEFSQKWEICERAAFLFGRFYKEGKKPEWRKIIGEACCWFFNQTSVSHECVSEVMAFYNHNYKRRKKDNPVQGNLFEGGIDK